MFGLTSAAVFVPEIVAGGGGHCCVPAGPFPRLVHKNTLMPPFTSVRLTVCGPGRFTPL